MPLAEKAGVPHQYRDAVWISKEANGATSLYFGGAGKPNGPFGPGHHHAVAYRETPYEFISDELR